LTQSLKSPLLYQLSYAFFAGICRQFSSPVLEAVHWLQPPLQPPIPIRRHTHHGNPQGEGQVPAVASPHGPVGKKIRGRYYYFGKDRDEALTEYVRVREDLEAGRKPRPKADDAPTVADVVNAFLTEKKNRVVAGELSARTWSDYYAACEAVVDEFGKGRAVADLRPDDFAGLRAK
jgi:hypothetical protein